ncbi:MAG: dynamin family protein [Treponema sp.]|nr:dynamin family protein [Treponema sp.]
MQYVSSVLKVMSVDYKQIEFALHEALVQIDNAYRLLEYDTDMLDKIQECMDLVKTKRYSVAVMGEFKRGKSSLINALLGSKILPADATPTTATINRITFASTPNVTISYKDGSNESIGINDLTDYVTKLTASGEHRAMKIKEATIYYPTQICQNYVDIIDTPGLNDEERMTKITIDMLENVDAVIVPIHARSPFSATEKGFVCQMMQSDNINNIVFVITFMDQLDEDDYEYNSFMDSIKKRIQNEVFTELEKRSAGEACMNKAHMILDNINLFAVSSSLALKAFITNNRTDLKKSGFEELNAGLLRIVTAKQVENAVRKSTEQINFLISAMDGQNEKKVNCIKSEIEKIENKYETISSYELSAKKTLNKLLSDSYDNLEKCADTLNEIKKDAVSVFIKCLCETKADTHESIKAALIKAVSLCEAMINEKGLTAVKKNLLQRLNADIDELKNYRESSMLSALSSFEVSSPDTLCGDMLSNAQGEFNKINFNWIQSAIPQTENLAEYNVIETAIEAVDISLNACVKTLKDALTEIRKNWFIMLEDDAGNSMNIYHKNHEIKDNKLNMQINNYRVLKEKSQAILTRCIIPD